MSSTGVYDTFNMGRVASRTFGAIGRNAVTFFLLAAIAVIPQLLLSGYLGIGDIAKLRAMQPGNFLHYYTNIMAVNFVALIFMAILQAALVHGTVADLNGKKAPFGDCLSTGVRTCLPVIGLSILFGIAMVFGLLLLIVPGIILGLTWIVAVPVLVVEKTGVFEAFRRSAQLTKGHRWVILALAIVTYLITFALSLALVPFQAALILGNAGSFSTAPFLALSGIIHVFTSTLIAAGIAALYYELRSIKEGIAPEQLSAVFD